MLSLKKSWNRLFMNNRLPNTIEESKSCDRCGNDLTKGRWAIHLPFRNKYVVLCHICINGLVMGFAQDFNRTIINWKKESE